MVVNDRNVEYPRPDPFAGEFVERLVQPFSQGVIQGQDPDQIVGTPYLDLT